MLVTFGSIKGYGKSDLLKSDLSIETSCTNVTCAEVIYFTKKNREEDPVSVSEVWYWQSFN